MGLNLEGDMEGKGGGGGSTEQVVVAAAEPGESSKLNDSSQSSKDSENVSMKGEMEATLDPETEAEVEKEQHESKKDAKVFPPPVSWFNANAVASRPEMFAYIGQNSLVVGKVRCREVKSVAGKC